MSQEQPCIGVYVCHCGTNIAGTVDVEQLARFVEGLPGVVVSREYKYMCSNPGQELIREDIQELGLNRVVVASCSPLLHEHTFRRVCEEAGLNPFFFQMANIREQCSWVHEDREQATHKAKVLVTAAVWRVARHEPLEIKHVPVQDAALVVGGGIAGIEAALQLADAGKQVYLVEREPSIGGHMAMFDKTFPTLDCAACILTPKMTQVGQHGNVTLLTYSEVEEVSGYVGNFKVRVLRKPRYVQEDLCTGCGLCTDVCPSTHPSEFDQGLGTRKAIYRPFPQAVPNAFVIDKKMPPCQAACPAKVGACGYVVLTAHGKFREALQLIKERLPFPSICGRVCHRPCEKACTRAEIDEPVGIAWIKRFIGDLELEEEAEPALPSKREGWVAVIGAGPAGLTAAHDLARLGYPVTVFEKTPVTGGMMRLGIPAFRLSREILDREISVIEKLGVTIKTGKALGRDFTLDELLATGYKAVFMAVGAQVGRRLNIPGEDLKGVRQAIDFLRDLNLGKPVEVGENVVVIGGGNAALDTARSALRMGAKKVRILYRRSRIEMPAEPEWEIDETEHEGVKIEYLVAPVRVLGKDGQVTGLECVRMRLTEPDESGRRRPVPVPGTEFTIECDTLLPAIGQAVEAADLAGVEGLALTRWGTVVVDPVTLQTTRPGVFAGGDAVLGPATLIEAIGHGKEAAVSIDRYIRGVDLKAGREEKWMPAEVDLSEVKPQERVPMPLLPLDQRMDYHREVELGYTLEMAVAEAQRCLSCGVCAWCKQCVAACDAGAIDHDMQPEHVELDVGAIVVATGFQPFAAERIAQYGYGRLPDVITGLEFERMANASGPTGGKIALTDGRAPESVAILHCIGSRDVNYHEYCSRVCCMYSLKFAHLVREKTGARVHQFYIDMRAFGKGYEEFYKRLLNEDVVFVRGKAAEVTDEAETPEEQGKLVVVAEDTLLGEVRRVPVDMVVLSTGLEPRADVAEVARVFGISRSRDGFFLERHPKLAPVQTANDGVFIAGACQGPKDIPDSVAQGAAAAAGALALLDRGQVAIEPITAVVDEERCGGCRVCVDVCPSQAISLVPLNGKVVAYVNEALCKGCGTCVAACPSGAAIQRGYTREQIFAEIDGALTVP